MSVSRKRWKGVRERKKKEGRKGEREGGRKRGREEGRKKLLPEIVHFVRVMSSRARNFEKKYIS